MDDWIKFVQSRFCRSYSKIKHTAGMIRSSESFVRVRRKSRLKLINNGCALCNKSRHRNNTSSQNRSRHKHISVHHSHRKKHFDMKLSPIYWTWIWFVPLESHRFFRFVIFNNFLCAATGIMASGKWLKLKMPQSTKVMRMRWRVRIREADACFQLFKVLSTFKVL